MRRRIHDTLVTPGIEGPTLLGCLSLVPYFAVIYALNRLDFVQEHVGIVASFLLGFFCILLLVFGGFLLNCMALEGFFIGNSDQRGRVLCASCGICGFWWLFLVSGILALSTNHDSPLHQYWQLSATPLQGLRLCSVDEWRDSTRGLYFTDGAISSNGHVFEPFLINVSTCNRMTTHSQWFSCSFAVRPVMSCDNQGGSSASFDCFNPEACAWDITRQDEPDDWLDPNGIATSLGKVPTCQFAGDGFCGWVTSLGRMVGRYNGGDAGWSEFDEGLKEAAAHFHINTSLDLPLLHLGDPKQAARELASWPPHYFTMVFLYVPATVLAMCILCIRQGGCERFTRAYLHVWEEVADTDDDDDDDD